MTTKTDPYATKLHKRVDALLLAFTILIIVLVLGTAARGQGTLPLAFAPQPFWTTLHLFKAEPTVSMILVAPSFLGESQPNYAAANGADLSALMGAPANSGFTPMLVLPEKSRPQGAQASNVDPGYGQKSTAAQNSSLADSWSRTAGVGSTIPAYSTGFGSASQVADSETASAGSRAIVGDDIRPKGAQNTAAGASPLVRDGGHSVVVVGSDHGNLPLSIGNGISVRSAAFLAGPSKLDLQMATPKGLTIDVRGPAQINASQIWSGGTGGSNTAWFSTGNWAGGAFPGSTPAPTTNTDIATIGSTGTNPDIGINLNVTGSTLGLGAITFDGASRGIGNSSNAAGAQSGTLRLNGATVNSVANTILRNFGSGTLTLYASAPGSGVVIGPMAVALGNATDNVLSLIHI